MRICLYAGPGTGKSTIAAYVFAHLKVKEYNIEHISEYIKTWAYEKRGLQGCDQFYIFAKQWRKEDIILRNGVDHLVTDSPLLMQCSYATKYGAEGAQEILTTALNIERRVDASYKSINIFLNRINGKYQQGGRYQDEAAALAMDIYIKEFLTSHSVKFAELPNDCQTVAEYCEKQLKLAQMLSIGV